MSSTCYLAPPLLTLGGLALAVAAAGLLAERLLPPGEAPGGGPAAEPPALVALRRACLGVAAWILLLFLAAAAGLLRPAVLVGAALVVVAGGAWTVRRRDSDRPVRARARTGVWPWLAVLGVVPLGLVAATPTVSWDAASYHLAVPRLYLEAGGFRPVPANVYAAWPLGVDLLFAPALAFGGVAAAKLVHWAFGPLLAVALAAGLAGAGRAGGVATAVAFLLVAANPLVGFELRVAYVDLAVAFFFLAGAVFLWRAADRPGERRRCLWLAGIAAALLVSAKVTGVVLAVVLALLYAPRLVRGGRDERLLFLRAFVTPPAVAAALWAAKAWWETGNPVYPFLHDSLGGPWWSAELTARLAAWQRSIGMGREPLDYLLLPWRVFTKGSEGYARFDGRLSPVWLALVPATLVFALRGGGGRGPRLARRALGAAGLVFVAWAATAQQMRFLLPAVPLLALAAAAGVATGLRRLAAVRGARVARAGGAVTVAAALALFVAAHGPLLATGLRLAGVFARVPAAELRASAVPPVFVAVAERVPADARILFLGTNQRFFCPREVLADSFLEASQIAAWLAPVGSPAPLPATVRRRLAAEGIDHVLVDLERAPAVGYPEALWRLLRGPDVTTLYREPGSPYVLLALPPVPGGAA